MTSSGLREWMKRKRYSIRLLSDALGLHPSTVQRYRDGSLPVPRTVELAVEHLDCLERAGIGR